MTTVRTSLMTASTAQICRDLGWDVGTRLQSIDSATSIQLRITAIGDQHVLALQTHHHGIALECEVENIWTLNHRDWQRI